MLLVAVGVENPYFSPDDFPFQFNHRNPYDIFAEFFGIEIPLVEWEGWEEVAMACFDPEKLDYSG